jgi:hypothetical protein
MVDGRDRGRAGRGAPVKNMPSAVDLAGYLRMDAGALRLRDASRPPPTRAQPRRGTVALSVGVIEAGLGCEVVEPS